MKLSNTFSPRVIILILFTFVLYACGGGQEPTNNNVPPPNDANDQTPPEEPTDTPTPPPQEISDGRIADLHTAIPNTSSLALRWTAPAKQTEQALSYDLRVSKRRIRKWMLDDSDVITITGLPAPAIPGTQEEYTVTGLQPDTTYYLSIRANYANNEISELSNLATGATLPPLSGRNIYVDSNSPAGGNGSNSSPFNRISDACSSSQDGDIIRVQRGLYLRDYCSVRSNTAIVSEDGPQQAILDGENQTQHLFLVYGDDDVIIDGFELRNTGGGVDGNDLIWIDGAGVTNGSYNIKLRNLYAHDSGEGGDCIKVTNYVYNFTLENSRLHSAWSPATGDIEELLDMKLATNVSIHHNWFYHVGDNREGAMAYSKTDSANIVFENNIFGPQSANATDSAVAGGWSSSSIGYNTDGLIIRNNLFFYANYSAVGVYGARNEFIHNNTFYNSGRANGGIIRIQEGGSQDNSDNIFLLNNIIVDSDGLLPSQIVSRQNIAAVTNFQNYNNLYWNNGNAIPSGSYINPVTASGFLEADPGYPTASIQITDHSFDSLIDLFYASAADNSSVDTGADTTSLYTSPSQIDILGTARYLGSNYDRGIFEFFNTP